MTKGSINQKTIVKCAVISIFLLYLSFYILLSQINIFNSILTQEIEETQLYRKNEPNFDYTPTIKQVLKQPKLTLGESIYNFKAKWYHTYGSANKNEIATAVVATADGGFLVAGNTESSKNEDIDIFLLKTDSTGDLEWNRTYGGPQEDKAAALILTKDGGYGVAGYTKSYGAGDSDIWFVKLDGIGYPEWNRTYGGPQEEGAAALITTKDGNFIVAGYTTKTPTTGHTEMYLMKLDSTGNMEWNHSYGGTGFEHATTVIPTIDGGYALVGWTCSYLHVGSEDMYIVKVNALGDIEWTNHYGHSYFERAFTALQTTDGGYLLAGRTIDENCVTGEMLIVKTDMKGDLEWSCTPGEAYHPKEWGFAALQTTDGGYFIAGGRETEDYCHPKVWLVKLNDTGGVVFEGTYDFERESEAMAMIESTDDSFVLAGYAYSYETQYDILLAKMIDISRYSTSSDKTTTSTITPGWTVTISLVVIIGFISIRQGKKRIG